MFEWLKELFTAITLQSALIGVIIFVITFAASLGIVSLVLVKLPATYFKKSHDRTFLANRPAILRWLAIAGKNFLGLALVALGIVLSLPGVPGQGMLTILLGIMLLDFPGKLRFEYWLVSRPKILHAINRLRHRFSKPELVLD
jgi:hypothetical protein